MSKLAAAARRFACDETGATMAEYALLIAVIAMVCVASARALGTNINAKLSAAATEMAK